MYDSDNNRHQPHEAPPLCLITSDASRGANRLTGLASIIRRISKRSSGRDNSKNSDDVTVTTRRINACRCIDKSEIAAITLGIKTLLRDGERRRRRRRNGHVDDRRWRVLILTDSASAISFFCGNGAADAPRHHAWKHVCALKERSEDVRVVKVKSQKSRRDGFFDHEVADTLSSLAKKTSNKDMSRWYQSLLMEGGGEVEEREALFHVTAPSLRTSDLTYLSSSEDGSKDSSGKVTTQVEMKKGRWERLQRCKARLYADFGLMLP